MVVYFIGWIDDDSKIGTLSPFKKTAVNYHLIFTGD